MAAEKKTPFLVQLKQIFGPSYFVRALVFMRFDLKVQKNSREIFQVQFFSSKLKDSIYEKYRKKLC